MLNLTNRPRIVHNAPQLVKVQEQLTELPLPQIKKALNIAWAGQ